MANGYTQPLHEGKDITFRQFAMRCSRGMMALFSMRDHSLDAEIPERIVPSDYHEKQITEWKAALAAAESITEAEAELAAAFAYDVEVMRREEARQSHAARRKRYEAMLAQVEAWQPPTKDHEDLKRFMMEQIQESMRLDSGKYDWPEPCRMTGAEFRSAQIEDARERLAYHEQELAKKRERCDIANAWLSALRSSLPGDDVR